MAKFHEGVACVVLIFKALTVSTWMVLLYLMIDAIEPPGTVWTAFWVYIVLGISQAVVSTIYELAKRQHEEETLKKAMDGISRIANVGAARNTLGGVQ